MGPRAHPGRQDPGGSGPRQPRGWPLVRRRPRPCRRCSGALAFGVFGFFLPDLLLINKAQHRSEQIQKALPDSIDLLTISVESGLAFDAALAQVARNTDGPLAEEFTRVLKEIQIGSGTVRRAARLWQSARTSMTCGSS